MYNLSQIYENVCFVNVALILYITTARFLKSIKAKGKLKFLNEYHKRFQTYMI